MTIVFEMDGDANWKPGIYRSRSMTRVWWLWFAVSWLHIPFLELVTKEFDWLSGGVKTAPTAPNGRYGPSDSGPATPRVP